MAKVGEGDPRWIVSQRQDGKNVNSWHWEERDLSDSTHEQLKALFDKKELTKSEEMTLFIHEVTDVNGDVTVAQRKGKIMCYFELRFTLNWKGTVRQKDKDCAVSGKCTVPEVDHDTFTSPFEISVGTTENDAAHMKAHAWLCRDGRKAIHSTFRTFVEELFSANNVGAVAKDVAESASAPKPKSTPKTVSTAAVAPTTASTSFEWKMLWRAPIEEIFMALTKEERVAVYTRAPANVDPRPTGIFSLLGGAITGYFVDVTFPTKISMQWRLSSWRSQLHSTVVILLTKEEPALTRLEFAHAGIPAEELERVKEGWLRNIFEPMKMMLGYSMEFL